jgi:hypothetical protein
MSDKIELTGIISESFDKGLKETIDQIYSEPPKPVEKTEKTVPEKKEEVEETKEAVPEKVRENQQSEKPEAEKKEEIEKEDEAKPEKDEKDEKIESSEKEPEKNDIEIKLPRNMPKNLKAVLENISDKNVVKGHIDVYNSMTKFLHKRSRELSKQQHLAESVNSVFKKYGKGKEDKLKLVESYLNMDTQLVKTPDKALELLLNDAEKRGFNIDDFLYKYQTKRDSLSPEQKKAQQEVEFYKKKLSTYENYVRERDVENISKKLDTFKNAKNSKDELKYPHFEEVAGEMAKQMQFDETLTLEKAYNKVIRLNDDFFEEMKKKELEKDKKKLQLEKAKKISSQNIKSRPSTTQTLSSDELLWKALEQCGL